MVVWDSATAVDTGTTKPAEPSEFSSEGQAGSLLSGDSPTPNSQREADDLAILPADSRLPAGLDLAARELSVATFGHDALRGLGKVVKPSEHWEGAVLVRGSRLLGFVVFGYRRPAVQMSVKFIAVDPQDRRCGYGRGLLAYVKEKSTEANIRRITLTCKRDNVDAQGFYKALGYSDETSRWRKTDPSLIDINKLRVFEDFL
mmetsp:Transcript_93982/g.275094  ORF Transcript_93982/g.275094 Transcript_93982/m.275094 type:complete len:202 (+) Transcript_93982:74-679(+)